jgi:hypothetical protein
VREVQPRVRPELPRCRWDEYRQSSQQRCEPGVPSARQSCGTLGGRRP